MNFATIHIISIAIMSQLLINQSNIIDVIVTPLNVIYNGKTIGIMKDNRAINKPELPILTYQFERNAMRTPGKFMANIQLDQNLTYRTLIATLNSIVLHLDVDTTNIIVGKATLKMLSYSLYSKQYGAIRPMDTNTVFVAIGNDSTKVFSNANYYLKDQTTEMINDDIISVADNTEKPVVIGISDDIKLSRLDKLFTTMQQNDPGKYAFVLLKEINKFDSIQIQQTLRKE